jgi:2-C-methyl-D-erythritol 4-phosphate cytidylyltransferase
VVALAAEDPYWPRLALSGHGRVATVQGGDERAVSVGNALDWLAERAAARDRVLVHDAARPCLNRGDLDRLLREGMRDPSGALLAAPVADTLKRDDGDGRVAETMARDGVWRALTPQLFPIDDLRRALREHRPDVTDESGAMELAGFRPRLVNGDPGNIKITTRSDLLFAERLLGGAR